MNTVFANRSLHIAAAALLVLLLGACATTPSTDEGATEKTYKFEPWDGDGMEIPLDGSSLEAFKASMARVKAYTTPDQYTSFENAIDYLLVYDLNAKHDMTRLAAELDGLTPYEVMQRINWRRPKPGMSPVEKGAADAKIDL